MNFRREKKRNFVVVKVSHQDAFYWNPYGCVVEGDLTQHSSTQYSYEACEYHVISISQIFRLHRCSLNLCLISTSHWHKRCYASSYPQKQNQQVSSSTFHVISLNLFYLVINSVQLGKSVKSLCLVCQEISFQWTDQRLLSVQVVTTFRRQPLNLPQKGFKTLEHCLQQDDQQSHSMPV